MIENDRDKNTSPSGPLSYEEERAQRQREYQEKAERNRAEMAILLTAPPDEDGALESALTRQSIALDRLFARTMMDSADPCHTTEKLLLAMRMQRECRETIQALARVQRTKSLTERTTAIKNARNPGKRNESDSRLYDTNGRLIYDFSAEEKGTGG